MKTLAKVVTVAALAAAAALPAWWPRASDIRLSPRIGTVTAVEPSPAAAAPTPSSPEPAERVVVPAEPARRSSSVAGCCVDVDGRPLAGIRASFTAPPTDWNLLRRWRLDHLGEPEWCDPEPIVTGADGVFRCELVVPSVRKLTLVLASERHVARTCSWPKLEPGSVIDLGRIVMHVGARLSGRVALRDGTGVSGIDIRLQTTATSTPASSPPTPPDGGAITDVVPAACSAADGTFAFASGLTPGEYMVTAHSFEGRAEAVPVALRADEASTVQFVWEPAPASDSISGRVVGDRGEPLHWASVCSSPPRGLGALAYSEHGRFRVEKNQMLPAEGLTFLVWHEGFEVLRDDRRIPWGTHGVELRLHRGAPLAVRVTDERGAAIRDFSVRIRSTEGNVWGAGGMEPRASGTFDDGVAVIDGVGAGKWQVLIEFPSRLRLFPTWRSIEMVAGQARQLDVQALDPRERTLRVVSRGGEAIVGSTVQLYQELRTSNGGFETVGLPAVGGDVREPGVFVQRGKTDASGRLGLRGPIDRPLGLTITGEGHPAAHCTDVSLTTSDELVVEVDTGGTVKGRLEPTSALDSLRRLVFPEPSEAAAATTPVAWIALVSPTQRSIPDAVLDARFPIAADGAFEVTQVPSGRWSVQLRHRNPRGLRSERAAFDLGSVEVRTGATATIVGDVNRLVYGRLIGDVTRNGERLANEQVVVEWLPTAGVPAYEAEYTTTDAMGRFDLPAHVGTCRVSLRGPGSPSASELAVIRAGETVMQRFTLTAGNLVVTVRDATGAVVPRAVLYLDTGDESLPFGSLWTDDQGIAGSQVSALSYRLLVLVNPPTTAEQGVALGAQLATAEGRATLREQMVELGRPVVRAGEVTNVEVRWPAAVVRR